MGRSIIVNRLVEHALLVRSDRPTYDEDGNLLGHWQDEQWIKRLIILAQTLQSQEDEWWKDGRKLERE